MSRWCTRAAAGGLLCALLAISACSPGGESAPPEEGIVARIDTIAITADELRTFVLPIPEGLRPKGEGDAARKEYLRSLLAKYLLQIEGKARGLDTLESVRKEVEKRWRHHLVNMYRREAFSVPERISEEEIQRYFEENDLGRRRKLAGILVDDQKQAREVVQRLDAGEEFAEVARKYSIDKRSVEQGGVLGFVSLPQARRLRIPDEVFRLLPQGKHSGVLPMGKRYQVVCFLQDSLVGLEQQRGAIERVLGEQKRIEQERKAIQEMAEELGWKLDREGLHLLLDRAAGRSRLLPGRLSPEEASHPLFTYQGGEVTLGEYLDLLWENPLKAVSGWGVRDSAEVMEAAASMVVGPVMLLEAARRAGIPERPEEQRWLERTRTEFLLRQMRRREAVDKASVDEAEAKAFYEEHPEIFRRHDQFYLVEILVKTRKEALDLLDRLDEGETISSLAQKYTLRPGMRKEAGMMHLQEYERLMYPRLYKAALEAEEGEIVGPVEVEGGYSIFKVLYRKKGGIAPFSEVERRARAFVRRKKKDLLFEELVDELMEKYRDRIVVYQEELARALPDTFLQRLAPDGQGRG